MRGTGRALCPACGSVLQPPQAVPAGGDQDHIGFEYQPSARLRGTTPPAPQPPASSGHAWPLIAIAFLLGVALAAGVTLSLLNRRAHKLPAPVAVQSPPPAPPAWDVSHRTDLLQQKARLDQLALAGQLQVAFDGYAQLLQSIASHDVTDPTVQQLVQNARASQQVVFAALLHRREQAALAAQPPTASPAPAASANSHAVAPSVPSGAPTASAAPPIAAAQPSPDASPYDFPIPASTQPSPAALALHTYTLPNDITDAQIANSLHRGVMFLQRAFRNGELAMNVPFLDPQGLAGLLDPHGVDALCVYALLQAGQAVKEPWLSVNAAFTRQMLDALKRYNLLYTYHRSLRAAALAVYNRPEDFQALEADVRWLIADATNGAYTYTPPAPQGQITPMLAGTSARGYGNGGGVQMGRVVAGGVVSSPGLGQIGVPVWDNSNSQYGLLGVWSGAEAGVAVPNDYWEAVENHWLSCQLPDGQWPYTANAPGRLSMTDAGLASLLVTRDYLDPVQDFIAGMAGHSRADHAQELALHWLDTGDNAVATIGTPPFAGYKLYGLERVGLASGFKFFGTHDWYAELAKKLIDAQHGDGSWGADPPTPDTAIDTAYALLFLARGRHPVLYNKLRFDGDWHDYPHDIANLTKFASYELQRPLNWQVINTGSDWPTWMDSPVLYIATDAVPNFSPEDLAKFRDYALAGGLIFTHADGGSPEVNHWVTRFAHQLFPDLSLAPITSSSPVLSSLYNLQSPVPDLLGVSNGSRLLMVHSPRDIAQYWQHQWTDSGKTHYQLALNLFIYANGKTELHNRLESPYIPPFPGVPQGEIPVLRLRYGDSPVAWNPEPYAWTRFRNYFQWETHRDVAVQQVDLARLQPGQAPLAVLTGTAAHVFTPAEIDAARNFVRGGGILLIDACGGSPDFTASVEQTLLAHAFPNRPLHPLTATHPVLRAVRPGADDLTVPLLRPYAKDLAHNAAAPTPQVLVAGRGQVIFSPLDLTTGLLDTTTYGINGYDPLYAAALVKNTVLWADARSAQPPATQATPPAAP